MTKYFTSSLPRLLAACALLSSCCSNRHPPELAPFHSDGCTAFPDSDRDTRVSWADCCLEHDIAYWVGGSRHDRLHADRRLRACLEKYPTPLPAAVVERTVRITGWPYWPTPFRWGFGWPFPRGYREIDVDQRARAAALLARDGYPVPDWLLFPPGP